MQSKKPARQRAFFMFNHNPKTMSPLQFIKLKWFRKLLAISLLNRMRERLIFIRHERNYTPGLCTVYQECCAERDYELWPQLFISFLHENGLSELAPSAPFGYWWPENCFICRVQFIDKCIELLQRSK